MKVLAACVVLSLAACTSSPVPPVAETLPDSPLPPCPGTPNCVRETRVYRASPDALFEAARAAVDALGPAEQTADAEARRLSTVVRVFVFRDDVAVAVEPYADGAALHVRSASRTGHSDLGVNGRRARRLFEAVEERLGG